MFDVSATKNWVETNLSQLSSETVGWLAVLFLHCATIPSLVGILMGVSDKLPTLDVVLFLWTGLLLLFVKALINRDMLNILTISGGFIVQAGLLGMLVFR